MMKARSSFRDLQSDTNLDFYIQGGELDASASQHFSSKKKAHPQRVGTASTILTRESSVNQQDKKNEAYKEWRLVDDKLTWVGLKLSHHIVTHQSVCFVLDNDFEHFSESQNCRQFVWDTFNLMDDRDYFGIICLDRKNTQISIDLEKVGKNRVLKQKMLYNGLIATQDELFSVESNQSAFVTCL